MQQAARGLVLATGTYDARAHPRVQVLVDGLRDSGWDVEEIVEALALTTAERVDILRRPVLLPRLAVAVGRSWSRLVPRLRARRRRSPRPAAVLVGYLGHFDVALVRRLVRPVPVVLDHLVSGAGTAADRGERGGLKQRALRALDELALRSADVVVVDTEEHRVALPARHRDRAVVVPVGAERRWEAAPRGTRGGRLSVVFFGLFTPLQGTTVVAEAVRGLAGAVDVTLVGRGQDWAAVRRILAGAEHVTWLDWVPAEDLPGLVARHDVCLGIFGTGPKALDVVPTKVYQGLAAGCVVVTSDTPPQRRVLGDRALFVPPGDPAALGALLRDLADDPERLGRLARAAERSRGSFAPRAVVEPLARALESLS